VLRANVWDVGYIWISGFLSCGRYWVDMVVVQLCESELIAFSAGVLSRFVAARVPSDHDMLRHSCLHHGEKFLDVYYTAAQRIYMLCVHRSSTCYCDALQHQYCLTSGAPHKFRI